MISFEINNKKSTHLGVDFLLFLWRSRRDKGSRRVTTWAVSKLSGILNYAVLNLILETPRLSPVVANASINRSCWVLLLGFFRDPNIYWVQGFRCVLSGYNTLAFAIANIALVMTVEILGVLHVDECLVRRPDLFSGESQRPGLLSYMG